MSSLHLITDHFWTQALLDVFWTGHDPTSKHKRQYMSAIFYHDEGQKRDAESTLKDQEKKYARPVATQILPVGIFTDAEDYHQKYRLRHHSFLLDSLHLNDSSLLESHLAARLNGWLSGYGTISQFEDEKDNLGLNNDHIQYLRRNIQNAVRHC